MLNEIPPLSVDQNPGDHKPVEKTEHRDEADTLVKYGLMVALIAAACVNAVNKLGTPLHERSDNKF